MKEQTKAQLRAEIERLNGVASYYRAETHSIDYGVYLLLADLIESNQNELMEDLNCGQTSEQGAAALNRQYDQLSEAYRFLRDIPKIDDRGRLLRVDNGTVEGGYA
jgi:hypothetical protein